MVKTSIPKLNSIKFKTGAFVENVVYPHGFKKAENIPPINVLEGAVLENLRDVVLIGYTQDDQEYIAGTMRSPKDAAYMFGRAQLNMLRKADSYD